MAVRLPRHSRTSLVITRSARLTLALAILLWLNGFAPLRDQAWVRHALMAFDGSRCQQPSHSRGRVARAQSVREVSWSVNGGPPSSEKRLAAVKDRFREAPGLATLAELLRAAGPMKALITNCTDVQGHWQVNLLRDGNKAPIVDPARLLLGMYTGRLGRVLDMEITSPPVAIIAANGTVETRVGLRWAAYSDEVTLRSRIVARQNQLEQSQQTAHSAAFNLSLPFTLSRKLDVIFRDSDLLILRDAWGAMSALWRLPTDNAPVKRKPRLQGTTSTGAKLGKSVVAPTPNVRYPGLELRIDKVEKDAELGRLRTNARLSAANADLIQLEERVREQCQGISQSLAALERRAGDNHGELQELGRDAEELRRSYAMLEEAFRSSSTMLQEERAQTNRRLQEMEERVAVSAQSISALCAQNRNFSTRLSELEGHMAREMRVDDDLQDLEDLVGNLEERIIDLESESEMNSSSYITEKFQDLDEQLLDMKTNNERIKASQEDVSDRVFSDLHQVRSRLEGVEMHAASAQEGMQMLSSRVEDIDRRDFAPKGWVEQRLGDFWRQMRTRLRTLVADDGEEPRRKRLFNFRPKEQSVDSQSHFNVMMRLAVDGALDRLNLLEENLTRRLTGDRQGATHQELKKRVEQQGKAIASLKERLDAIDKLLFSM